MNIKVNSDYDDYYQVGVIGLINATKTYNYNFKISFSTYAYICIKNEVLKYIKKNEKKYISIEEKVNDDLCIEDTIEDENCNIIENIIINETNEELYEILDKNLNDMERQIIKMSYGIGCREYKQREIADILNIQQYKVSRIKNRLLKYLKDCINKW